MKGTAKAALYGAALLYGLASLSACGGGKTSTSTEDDFSDRTYQPYNVSYEGNDGVKAILSDENNLDAFSKALMSGNDVGSYTLDEVKSELRKWTDGQKSNYEMYYGMNVNDVDNIVTLRFGEDANTPSFAMTIKLSEDGMTVVKSIFKPIYEEKMAANLSKKLDDYVPTKKVRFTDYMENIRR